MLQSSIFLVFGVLMLITGASHGQSTTAATAAPADEIQVLIDVSGSMKQNDPDNLRIDASRLLISLLPEAATIKLWLFAEKTAPLSETAAVTPAWRQQAMAATAKIHSRGVYTHIEDALQTALNNGFQGSGTKHLLLLTDGFVDISKDIMQSADSRERILSEWIPKLQQRNIQVQTIALSDQADKELLEKLAFETGGWAETAQSAEQLQRVFLKMAQKVAPKDSLPLSNNRFSVDAGIKEFSVLVFKKPHTAPTQLLTPDHKKINRQSPGSTVAWLESPAYDLITVKQPLAGEWQIEAEMDPDNQVMIITDLKLQLADLPNFISEKEALELTAHFTEQKQLISRADFLNMLTLQVSQDQHTPLPLPAVTGEPGYFRHVINDLPVGKHLLKIVADGKTFQRESTHEIEVIATSIALEKQIDPTHRQVILNFVPDPARIDASGMVIQAVINQTGKPSQTQEIKAQETGWTLTLADLAPGSSTLVSFNVMAKNLHGKPLTPAIKPITIDDSDFLAAQTQPQPPPPVAEDAPHENAQQQPAIEQAAETHDPAAATEINWLAVVAIVLAVNLLLIAAGYFIYQTLKKNHGQKQQQLLERLS